MNTSRTGRIAKRPASLVQPDTEQGLIGSILVQPELFADVRAIVPIADALATDACRRLYAAMLTVHDDGKLPNVDAVFGYLGRIGGIDAELRGFARLAADSVPVGSNAVPFARDVAALYRKRTTALRAERIVKLAENGAEEACLADAIRNLAADAEAGLHSSASRAGPIVVRMADLQPEPVRWLWPGRIARGKLTILVGDPGLGKSFLTCDLATRVSCGLPWPDDRTSYAPLGSVVILNCEDDLADTIRPRLDAHGADVAKIVALSGVRDAADPHRPRLFDLSHDLPALEQTIVGVGDCRLVIVDPVTAYLGVGTDSHKAADVRTVLAPLSELAARHGVAIVAVSHLNKGTGAAMYRTMGSLAFVAAARAVWCVTRDRDQPERRLLLPVKNNLGNDRSGLAYAIVDGTVAWERDPVTVTIDDALAGDPPPRGPEPDERNEAEAFLRGALAHGPRPMKELETEAREGYGISTGTLRRAKTELGVRTYRATIPGPWLWRWPDSKVLTPAAAKHLEHLEHLASNAGKKGWLPAVKPQDAQDDQDDQVLGT